MTTGRCLCGAVTFTARGALEGVHVCHCRDCARWNGGPSIAAAFTEGFAVDGPVRWFSSSDWAERGSCDRCGAALFWRAKDGSMMNAGVGTFDDQSVFAKVDDRYFIDRKPAFYDFADDAPRLTRDEVFAKYAAPGQEP